MKVGDEQEQRTFMVSLIPGDKNTVTCEDGYELHDHEECLITTTLISLDLLIEEAPYLKPVLQVFCDLRTKHRGTTPVKIL